MDRSNALTDDVDGGVISKENCRVWRKDRRKVIDEDGEEEGKPGEEYDSATRVTWDCLER